MVPRVAKKDSNSPKKRSRTPLSMESRETQMISLAVDLAEQQLRDGTASSQVITHYLKLASSKDRIEREILEKQKELIVAKTENLKMAKRSEELFDEAIKAMRAYRGDYDDYD